MPEARSFHKLYEVGGQIYLFGGCPTASKGRLNDLHHFDPATSEWRRLRSSEAIDGRGGPGFQGSPDGKYLYVSSGYAGRETNDIHRYSVEDDSWTQLDDYPEHIEPRSVTANITLAKLNLILLFGGEVSISAKGHEGAGGFQNELLCLDISKDKVPAFQLGQDWAQEGAKTPSHENAPCSRGWLDGAEIKTEISVDGSAFSECAIFGGLGGNDDEPIRYNDLWIVKIERK